MHSRKSSRLWFDSSTKQNLRHSQSRWRLHRKITRHLIFQHRFVWRLNNFPSESLKTSMSKCQNVCCQRQRFCEVVIDSYSASLVLDYHQQPFFVLATKPKHLVVRTCPESHPDFPCKFQHSRRLQSRPSTLPTSKLSCMQFCYAKILPTLPVILAISPLLGESSSLMRNWSHSNERYDSL